MRGAGEGARVISARLGRQAAAAAIGVALLALPAERATAQITFGSPGEPPHIALGAGAFDITPGNHRDSHTAAEFRGEYRFGDVVWPIAPFLGVQGTSDGAFYGYGGFGVDVNFSPNLVLTPNFAAGYFAPGSGTRLGYSLEFRSGAELAWRFADTSRLGVAFHHISNAGLGKHNPGEQEILLMYSLPLSGPLF
jgi:hypothetical protein